MNTGNIIGIFLVIILLTFPSREAIAQSAWPSVAWNNAENLSPILDTAGVTELSGLFWNEVTNRLYVSHGDGRLRVLQLNTSTNTFSQIAYRTFAGGPEGITQVDLNANEFWTIDENNYEIRKYTHPANFSSVTLANSWNITAAPSPMINTANIGPEGITFVPDSFLNAVGFISQATGLPYTSTKGMGGLIFVAHQSEGYIWVFDINPNVSNNFAYVGKYRTSRLESCELAFDRSTGLLYILHNINGNILETSDLTSISVLAGERQFVKKSECFISNPSGVNANVEGFAINSKCNDTTNVNVWLCRDVESFELQAYKQDCLRWFKPFSAPGGCRVPISVTLNLKVFIQGFYAGSGTLRPVIDPFLYPNNCDTITVELRNLAGNHSVVYSTKTVVDINGNATLFFPDINFGSNYYIAIHHRNSLETWSSAAVLFNSSVISYNFTDALNKAYGNKVYPMGGGKYAIYSGDVNQDGTINQNDVNDVCYKTRLFLNGYHIQDINGDRFVETTDYTLIENNFKLSVSSSHP